MNYITISVLCIASLMIGILSIFDNDLFSHRRRYQFIILAVVIIFEIGLDTISIGIDGKLVNNSIIYKTLKILEFTLVPFIPMFLSKLVSHRSYWKGIRKYYVSLIIINATAQVLTFFFPFMFAIEADGKYYRTKFSILYVIVLILCFILLLISATRSFTQNSSRVSYTLFSIDILLVSGMLIRVFNNKCNSDWLCITIGYFLFMIYFSNSYLKIDPLTSLLNRRAFNNKLSRISYSTAFIIIDANNFKDINDTYGHQCGDKALSKIAEAIYETYSKVGYCCRMGGDEFCVILKPQMLKKLTYETVNCDTYRMLERLKKKLDNAIERMTKEFPMLKSGVSQGFGIYYSLLENPEIQNYKNIEEVIKIADERMYRNKCEAKINLK